MAYCLLDNTLRYWSWYLSKYPISSNYGSRCYQYLPNRINPILVHRFTTRSWQSKRPYEWLAERYVHGSFTRLERQSQAMEDADGRRNSPISSDAPNFRFCSFDCVLGFCSRLCGRRLALNYIRTVLRYWRCTLRRIGRSNNDGSYALALEVGRLHPS